MRKSIKLILMLIITVLGITIQGISYSDDKSLCIDFSKNRTEIEELLQEVMINNKYDPVYLEEKGLFLKSYKLTLNKTDYIYYGELKNNKPHGMGALICNDESYYGHFKKGRFDDYGIYIGSYSVYEGEYREGKRNGEGNIFDCNNFYISDDLKITSYIPYYSGEFENSNYSGKGTLYYENGLIKYEGEFKNSDYSGKGTLYYENGSIKYEGEFKRNEYHGKGTLYNEDGTIKYKGKFKNGDIK